MLKKLASIGSTAITKQSGTRYGVTFDLLWKMPEGCLRPLSELPIIEKVISRGKSGALNYKFC